MTRSMLLAGLAATLLLPVTTSVAGATRPDASREAVPDPRGAIEALQGRILERNAEGTLDNRRARRALRDLDEIRRMDAAYRRDAAQPAAEQARDILSRLDALRGELGEGRPRRADAARDER